MRFDCKIRYSFSCSKAAAYRLTDQSVIAELTKNIEEDKGIRLVALWRMTDQVLLADIAKTDKDPIVCGVAQDRLYEIEKKQSKTND